MNAKFYSLIANCMKLHTINHLGHTRKLLHVLKGHCRFCLWVDNCCQIPYIILLESVGQIAVISKTRKAQ